MKRLFTILAFVLLSVAALQAQKVEVLYFKANLACCQAKACNAVEAEVKALVEKNFAADKVTFKEIKLADEANKELVAKHSAKSQTLVVVGKKKKKEVVADISEVVRNYSRTQNKEEFERDLVAKINEVLKN
jgi:hypothetical protein